MSYIVIRSTSGCLALCMKFIKSRHPHLTVVKHTQDIVVANYVIWHCVTVCGSYPSVKRRIYFITQMMVVRRIPQTMRMNIRCSHPYSKYNHYFNGGNYNDYCLFGSNAVQFGRCEPTFWKSEVPPTSDTEECLLCQK
jgi:hypothetical protein